jgi:hypothetical protein
MGIINEQTNNDLVYSDKAKYDKALYDYESKYNLYLFSQYIIANKNRLFTKGYGCGDGPITIDKKLKELCSKIKYSVHANGVAPCVLIDDFSYLIEGENTSIFKQEMINLYKNEPWFKKNKINKITKNFIVHKVRVKMPYYMVGTNHDGYSDTDFFYEDEVIYLPILPKPQKPIYKPIVPNIPEPVKQVTNVTEPTSVLPTKQVTNFSVTWREDTKTGQVFQHTHYFANYNEWRKFVDEHPKTINKYENGSKTNAEALYGSIPANISSDKTYKST